MKLTEKKYKKANEKVLACPHITTSYANTILQRVKLLFSDLPSLRYNYEMMIQDLMKAIYSISNSMKLIPTRQSVNLVNDVINTADLIFKSLKEICVGENCLDEDSAARLQNYIQFFFDKRSKFFLLILLILQFSIN